MKRKRFVIPSLLAAGFTLVSQAHAQFIRATAQADDDDPDAGKLLQRFSQNHYFTLASHSSHSSHSSHASHSSGYGGGGHYSHTSHTSHRSGTGGYSYDPYPAPDPVVDIPTSRRTAAPTPPVASPSAPQALFVPSNRASAPPPDGLPPLSGRTKRFASIVRRVQIALLAQDYYAGAIDGIVGSQLRSALRKFQKERGLDQTGTITPATLDALMVSSE